MEKENENEMIRLHSAGATIRHQSPFSILPSHQNKGTLHEVFLSKWVIPFYLEIGNTGSSDWITSLKNIKPEITPDVCLALLGDFNWRTRLVGAYFSAIKNYKEHIDIIGTHLLKSEVCCVGHIYALVLAFFNTEASHSYLNQYLHYYLTQPQLYFDQEEVMNAIIYLDKINNTQQVEQHKNNWHNMQQKRRAIEQQKTAEIAELLKKLTPETTEQQDLNFILPEVNKHENFNTDYFDRQIPILKNIIDY